MSSIPTDLNAEMGNPLEDTTPTTTTGMTTDSLVGDEELMSTLEPGPENLENAEIKKRGRPKKEAEPQPGDAAASQAPAPKKGRGRPKKIVPPSGDTPLAAPRPRGRPKKVEGAEPKPKPEPSPAHPEGKRGPGRPPKKILPITGPLRLEVANYLKSGKSTFWTGHTQESRVKTVMLQFNARWNQSRKAWIVPQDVCDKVWSAFAPFCNLTRIRDGGETEHSHLAAEAGGENTSGMSNDAGVHQPSIGLTTITNESVGAHMDDVQEALKLLSSAEDSHIVKALELKIANVVTPAFLAEILPVLRSVNEKEASPSTLTISAT